MLGCSSGSSFVHTCVSFLAGTDHHFHYGYFVGAAAAVASQNPGWYKAYLEPAVKALIRDYANNNKADNMFPFARHKDWYTGWWRGVATTGWWEPQGGPALWAGSCRVVGSPRKGGGGGGGCMHLRMCARA